MIGPHGASEMEARDSLQSFSSSVACRHLFSLQVHGTGALRARRAKGFTHYGGGVERRLHLDRKTVDVEGNHAIPATRFIGQFDPLRGGRYMPRLGDSEAIT